MDYTSTHTQASRLIPVVRSLPLVRDFAVINSTRVEPFELPVCIVTVSILDILLSPVNISGLRRKPSAVQGHEHYPGSHNDEQGLEGRVVLEGLQGGALHRGEGVVIGLTTSMTLKIGMVSSTEKLGKKHALTKSESE